MLQSTANYDRPGNQQAVSRVSLGRFDIQAALELPRGI